MSKNLKPLIVDKRDKVNGLYTYCGKCKKLIENRKCGETGKGLSTCKNTDKHKFRAVINVPNSTRRIAKVINTRNHVDAIRIKMDWEQGLKQNSYQRTDIHIRQVESRPEFLLECMAMYVGYLKNEGVNDHQKKDRSSQYIDEVERYFKKFCLCLKSNGLDYTLFRIDQVNDRVVSMLHSYLVQELNYSGKYYNKIMALYRQFLSWLINSKRYDLDNPFTEVARRVEKKDDTIVSQEEFKLLLDRIDNGNHYQTFPNGRKKNRFRPWLAKSIELALETGLRREELVSLQFTDIVKNENGEPICLTVDNLKVNRIKGGESFSNEKKLVPITENLLRLLVELGYQKDEQSTKYLIGDEDKMSRKTMMDFISKSFTHYWKQTGVNREVQLKHLRKTYLTALTKMFKNDANLFSGHSSMEVLLDHYVNSVELMPLAREFRVFK